MSYTNKSTESNAINTMTGSTYLSIFVYGDMYEEERSGTKDGVEYMVGQTMKQSRGQYTRYCNPSNDGRENEKRKDSDRKSRS